MSARQSLAETLRSLDACTTPDGGAVGWAEPYGTDYARAWVECPRGDWLLWLVAKLRVDRALWQPTMFAAADRAVRVYAPHRLRSRGLSAAAERLERLTPITDRETAAAAAYVADDVVADDVDADVADDDAYAAYVAAAYVAAAYAGYVAAGYVAAAAAYAAYARADELLLSATELRRAVPIAVVLAALEAAR